MKLLKIFLPILFLSTICAKAQNINWNSISSENKNLSTLDFGYDFGLTSQIGFYKLIPKTKPFYLGIDVSAPMGNVILDDFKLRINGLFKVYQINNYILSAKVSTNFKRHETEMVRMASFGSELSLKIGYYRPKWHVSTEFGHQKSISTHLKHSSKIRANYPDIKDGWYVPTGGNFHFGISGSKSINSTLALSFKTGIIMTELKDEKATIPMYGQLGLIKQF